MSDVFLSYKREDETRVARIARALIEEGLDVWWDQGLPGGENWRVHIEKALHAARCAVVAWSKASVAPEGHFVRDEAGQAMAKGILVPVFIDRVSPPVGFGELQGIDLTQWRGSRKDPFFQDLVAAIRAKLDGVPAPRAKGPAMRLWRRVGFGGGAAAAACIAATLAMNLGNVATRTCTVAAMQPGLSDVCGSLGIGGRPPRAERLFWQNRRPGSCEDVRRYIERYHDGGAYLIEANALLAARRGTDDARFVPSDRTLALYVMQADTAAKSEAASRAKAMSAARILAERNCRAFAQTTLFRFHSAGVEAQSWRCEHVGAAVACSLEGQAICHLSERQTVTRETCGR